MTNKDIIKDLDYFIILKNEEKLITQIFAVENNTKLYSQVEPKDTYLIGLSLYQLLNIIKSQYFQKVSTPKKR